MQIELPYFDSCPSWEMGLQNLKSAMQLEAIVADVDLVEIHDDIKVTRLKFLGSPSFRVDGHDLWPEECEIYSLSCRVYPTPAGIKDR